jgi:hypothetical protein
MPLSNEVLMVICIFGAAALATVAYAIFKIFSGKDDDDYDFTQSDEQKQYMRELRERNIMEAIADLRPQQQRRPPDA